MKGSINGTMRSRSETSPSPVPRRLEKAPSRDTLSPRERAGFPHPNQGRGLVFHVPSKGEAYLRVATLDFSTVVI